MAEHVELPTRELKRVMELHRDQPAGRQHGLDRRHQLVQVVDMGECVAGDHQARLSARLHDRRSRRRIEPPAANPVTSANGRRCGGGGVADHRKARRDESIADAWVGDVDVDDEAVVGRNASVERRPPGIPADFRRAGRVAVNPWGTSRSGTDELDEAAAGADPRANRRSRRLSSPLGVEEHVGIRLRPEIEEKDARPRGARTAFNELLVLVHAACNRLLHASMTRLKGPRGCLAAADVLLRTMPA